MTPPLSSRSVLVAAVRSHLQREGFPRATAVAMLLLAGLCAFVVSLISLHSGLDSMAARYGLATLAGYLAFLGLIRGWIAMRQGRFEIDGVDADFLDPFVQGGVDAGSSHAADAGAAVFAAGRSGGAGGGGDWSAPSAGPSSPSPQAGGAPSFDVSLDLDELWWLVLAAACALGGLIAISYVVYTAPVLLAEVALDAALVTAVARRLRKHEAGHWAGAAFRHTCVPAIVLVLFMTVLGFALQKAAPNARSIGGVVRELVAE